MPKNKVAPCNAFETQQYGRDAASKDCHDAADAKTDMEKAQEKQSEKEAKTEGKS